MIRHRVAALHSPVAHIWCLIGVTAAVALLLVFGPLGHLPAPVGFSVAWWSLVAGFALTEVLSVSLDFRGERHTFTLTELPLVIGLHLAAPGALLLGQVLGGGLCRLAWRQSSTIKQCFNLVVGALDTCVALLVLRALTSGGGGFGPSVWAATLVATLATTVLSALLVASVISITEGNFQLRTLPQTLGPSAIVTVTNTSIALACVGIMRVNPLSATLLVVPVLTLLAAYRAYTAERREHERVEFLLRCTRLLHEAEDTEAAVVSLLVEAREAFRAERAELVLLASDEAGPSLRTVVSSDASIERMVALADHEVALLQAFAATSPAAVLVDRDGHHPLLGRYLDERGMPDAMVAALREDERTVGVLIIAERQGEVARFDDADLRLFAALSHQASVSLDSDRLERALSSLREVQGQLAHQALHDPLTGLANRTLFADRVEAAMARREGDQGEGKHGGAHGSVAVMFIDLDDFKTINDGLGHDVGDSVLIEVAARIRSVLPAGDTPARLGGDEFAVLLDEATSAGRALEVADSLLEALRRPVVLNHREVPILASIGVALPGPGDKCTSDLLRNADVAMYAAKARGKGCVELFDPGMHAAALARHELKADLQHAIDTQELSVVFQPVVDLATGETVAAEALSRWRHPRRGSVPPTEFIPLAEETGLIVALGRSVLVNAVSAAVRWPTRTDGRALSITVNVSPRELRQADYVDHVLSVLAETGLDPRRLVLEITETDLVQKAGDVLARLVQLRAAGVRLAIDDFGTGYSSLSYLRDLPIDVLKIDRSFVMHLGEGERDDAFARAIVTLAASLGLSVVAEGVETEAQAAQLRTLDCELAQGFLYSPPLDDERFRRRLLLSPLDPAGDPAPAPVLSGQTGRP